ncbi:hypothetical protein A5320_03835 [Rheinheimera sp. SA_1]|uniref:hypothetical protein n=1 Tax=Rheinheimera sp. SA_1 TaxID=1827365 RepID=UPI0007FC564A|nr:hypothetical protein [Rheinheimera sp. SA_1]OBP16537.1 hypothetical protein A5320_03835 [Rheinheimera sp. SA_1]
MRNPAYTEDKLTRQALYISDRPDNGRHFNKLCVLLSDVIEKVNKYGHEISILGELDVSGIDIRLHKSVGRGSALTGHINNVRLEKSSIHKLRIVIDHFLETLLEAGPTENTPTIVSLIKCDENAEQISVRRQTGVFLQSLATPWKTLEQVLTFLLLDICMFRALFGSLEGQEKIDILSQKFDFDRTNFPEDFASVTPLLDQDVAPQSYSFAMSCMLQNRLQLQQYLNKWLEFKGFLEGANLIDVAAARFESTEQLVDFLLYSLGCRSGQINPAKLKVKIDNKKPGKYTLVFQKKAVKRENDRVTLKNYFQLRHPSDFSIIERQKETKMRHYIDRYCLFVRFTKEE